MLLAVRKQRPRGWQLHRLWENQLSLVHVNFKLLTGRCLILSVTELISPRVGCIRRIFVFPFFVAASWFRTAVAGSVACSRLFSEPSCCKNLQPIFIYKKSRHIVTWTVAELLSLLHPVGYSRSVAVASTHTALKAHSFAVSFHARYSRGPCELSCSHAKIELASHRNGE